MQQFSFLQRFPWNKFPSFSFSAFSQFSKSQFRQCLPKQAQKLLRMPQMVKFNSLLLSSILTFTVFQHKNIAQQASSAPVNFDSIGEYDEYIASIKKEHGEESIEVARAYVLKGYFLAFQESPTECVKIFQKALGILEQKKGKQDDEYIELVHSMIDIQVEYNMFEGALESSLGLITPLSEKYGEKSVEVAEIQLDLCQLYQILGDDSKAKGLLKNIQKNLLGKLNINDSRIIEAIKLEASLAFDATNVGIAIGILREFKDKYQDKLDKTSIFKIDTQIELFERNKLDDDFDQSELEGSQGQD